MILHNYVKRFEILNNFMGLFFAFFIYLFVNERPISIKLLLSFIIEVIFLVFIIVDYYACLDSFVQLRRRSLMNPLKAVYHIYVLITYF